MQDDFRPVRPTETQDSITTQPKPDPTGPVPAGTPLAEQGETGKPPVKRSGAKKWLLGGLLVLLLAGAGSLVYWQWQQAENARSEASFLRTALETAQNQNKKDATTPAATERVITTMELAERYAESYQGAGETIKFFTRVEKTDGDAALIYTKAEAPNAEPTYFVLKRVDDSVVAVDSFPKTMSELQAAILKQIYGIDATRLGVTVEQQ